MKKLMTFAIMIMSLSATVNVAQAELFCLQPGGKDVRCTNKTADCIMTLTTGLYYTDRATCRTASQNGCKNAYYWQDDQMCCASFQVVQPAAGVQPQNACPSGMQYMPQRTAKFSNGNVACCGAL